MTGRTFVHRGATTPRGRPSTKLIDGRPIKQSGISRPVRAPTEGDLP